MRKLWRRLLFLLRRHRFHREMEEEMLFHLEMSAETIPENNAARRRFGNPLLLRELSRDVWGFAWLESFLQDLRYGLRMLRRSPGFTAVAVLSLALGIGANTAIFSLIDAVMLKMLPVKDPEQLVFAQRVSQKVSHWGTENLFSYPLFARLRDGNEVFSGLLAVAGVNILNVQLSAPGGAGPKEAAAGQLVSGNFFSVLGVPAIIGRTFTPAEDQVPDGHPVAVISYGYWKRRFASNPSVVRQTMIVNGAPFTIIGVTPPEFFGVMVGRAPDIWMPAMMQDAIRHRSNYSSTSGANPDKPWPNQINVRWVQLMGRLRPGVSVPQARAGIDVLFRQSAALGYRDAAEVRIDLTPGGKGLSELRRRYSEPLWTLMAVVGLVLLIACANVANLLLARAAVRQREIAARLALGASRGRLIRQLLTESALLALLGGAVGLLVAGWGKHFLLALVSGRVSINAALDLRVLAFTAALSLATGILFGLAPALQVTGPNLSAPTASRGRFLAQRMLIASQVAVSTLLLVGAGLFLRNLRNLKNVDTGYAREGLLMVEINPRVLEYRGPQLADLYRRLLERLAAIPGVRSASLSLDAPVSSSTWTTNITVAGYTPRPDEDLNVHRMTVTARYFETVGLPMVEGRGFTEQDSANSLKVAVINETMARYFFPRRSALGQRFGLGGRLPAIEIVGVVRDAKYHSLKAKTPRMTYIPVSQQLEPLGALEVRVAPGTASAVAAQMRGAIGEVERNLTAREISTIAQRVDSLLAGERTIVTLASLFGSLALLLAAIGLYGLLSYAVARRTREIGVRMALGAQRGTVVWLIAREALGTTSFGIAAGLLAAAASGRVVASLLFGLGARDPATFAVAAAVMLSVAVLAGSLPARRAARVDPIVALRHE